MSECRGVDRCRGGGVSMPYTDGKHSLAKLQVSISEVKQYFHHDIYGWQPLAVACSCSVGRLAVARRGGGVHHGDGDGQAVVQEKAQHLQPSLRGRSTRKSRRASWPGARRARRCSRKATVSNGSLKSCRRGLRQAPEIGARAISMTGLSRVYALQESFRSCAYVQSLPAESVRHKV